MDIFFKNIDPSLLKENNISRYNKHIFALLEKAEREQHCRYYVNKNIQDRFVPEKGPSEYLDNEIYEEIVRANKTCNQLVILFPERKIVANFVSIDGSAIDISRHIRQLVIWFKLMNMLSPNNVNHTLVATVYSTDCKKKLPGDSEVLSSKHVNSAYTYSCLKNGEIIIYRKEEWFKVLLHESIHSFCLDFSLMDQKTIARKISGNGTIGAYVDDPQFSETYTEVWAELLQCAIASYTETDMDLALFSLYFDLFIQLEKIHSVCVSKKILSHQGYSFHELREKKYFIQKTHVFEYYILKTIILGNIEDFLEWCLKTNGIYMIPFKKKREACEGFSGVIVDSYKKLDYGFIDSVGNNIIEKNSLAMSITEI